MSDHDLISANTMVDNDFKKVYEPLIKKFIEEIKDVDIENLPEPFIPVYGKNYGSSEYRIAFVGWETRGNSDLAEFYEIANKDAGQALNRFFEKIDEERQFKMTGYGNNFGTGFWDFIFKFLAKFYNEDWKDIKHRKRPDILKSFIWGNLEAIERFEVTAEGEGGNKNEWEKVKKASKIFDGAELFIKALKPKIIIVLQWQEDDSWIKNITNFNHEIILDDTLEYYYLKSTDTHLYWTRHPGSLSRRKIDFNEIILRILISITEKGIFASFPGKRLFESIGILNHKLDELAKEFDLSLDILPYWGTNSGFYFTSNRCKNYSIGFEFDGNWGFSFFGGIRKTDCNDSLVSDKAIAQKLGMTEEPSAYWPYWFWFEEKYKTWDKKVYDELQNGNFISEIRIQIDRMLPVLEELESNNISIG